MSRPPQIADYFVCVGAQKAGTTWLARMLSRHPDIFFTPVKEIHYFDHVRGITTHLRDSKRRSRKRKFLQKLLTQWHRAGEFWPQRAWYREYMAETLDDDWYAGLFRERGGRRMAGEATPEYALLGEEGFRHIARLAPQARVIYIMRDPVTRAWSQLLHHCRVEGLNAARLPPEQLIAIASDPTFRAFGDYASVLNALDKVFPKGHVWTGFYEDIHADRMGALARISAFLGVRFEESWFEGLERRYNRSQEAKMPDEVRRFLREQTLPVARDVARRMGRLPESWRKQFGLVRGRKAVKRARARS
ncbi:MAG: sulfotransferase [Pseudomonadota bacterium]|nr:sulfotransferase [Pseudomonadota bacterium]